MRRKRLGFAVRALVSFSCGFVFGCYLKWEGIEAPWPNLLGAMTTVTTYLCTL